MAHTRIGRIGAAAAVALGVGLSASAQQPQRIELLHSDGRTVSAVIHVNSEALLLESGNQAVLYSSSAMFHIDHRGKTYYEQTYEDLNAKAAKVVRDLSGMKEVPPGIEFTQSTGTEVIAGCKTFKVTRINRTSAEGVFWQCKELLPEAVRKAGDAFASILPADYWRRVSGNPGLMETVFMYGVPVRFEQNGKRVWEARVTEGPVPADKFQLPAGYKKIPPPK